jgi:molybdenum cofactor guanylyltransferase
MMTNPGSANPQTQAHHRPEFQFWIGYFRALAHPGAIPHVLQWRDERWRSLMMRHPEARRFHQPREGSSVERRAAPRAVYHPPMDRPATDVGAFILAGGKSTRMGTDKAFIALDGRTLLARALEVARSVTDEVHIVGEAAKFRTFAPVVEDIFPACGPLGGIHASLRASQRELNLTLAVDTPFVSFALLQFLLTRARASQATVTVPRTKDGWQPLCAVYRREFADAAESALRAGRHKIDALFDTLSVQPIAEEELEAAGFSPTLFRNLNTPDDLAKARS